MGLKGEAGGFGMRCRSLFVFLLTGMFLAGAAVATPAMAKTKFVAVVITGDLLRYQQANDAFLKILEAGGLTKDQIDVYVQTPNPDPISWANSIRKAVGVGADLIVTYGAPATLVAKQEARSLPILFADVYDPVGLGIVKDLAVPGGDISGVSNKTPVETLLRSFADIVKKKTLGALFSPNDKGSILQVNDLEKAAANYGIKVVRKGVAKPSNLDQAAAELCSRVDALYIADSALLQMHLQQVLGAAIQKRIPVISQIPGLSDMGALITLEADPTEQGQLLGVHALQILTGNQRALELPVRTPRKVALVINMKVARELNLTVPFQALSLATRVVK